MTNLESAAEAALSLLIHAREAVDRAEAEGADNIDALREERSEATGLAEGVLLARELYRKRRLRKTALAQVRARVNAPEHASDPAWIRGAERACDIVAGALYLDS